MSVPLVSIVLPTYNGARYLEQSIQSCLNQTYRNWELIIVDDASTDETPRIIEKFVNADYRIRTVRHPINRKLPAALNTGFAEAKGGLLTWTSDDNCYRAEALLVMAEFLDANPCIGVVYCDYSNIDDLGEVIHKTRVGSPEMLAIGNYIGCCFLYRREVADKVGEYSKTLFLAEDYDFWLRASIESRMVPLHQDLYFYRYHADTLTERRKESIAVATVQTLAINLPKMNWLSDEMRAKGYIKLYKISKLRKDWINIIKNLSKAINYAPLFTFGLIIRSILKLPQVVLNENKNFIKNDSLD